MKHWGNPKWWGSYCFPIWPWTTKDLDYDPRHLPVIPIKVGWHPAHWSQPYPSDYWYVTSRDMLWSFFRKYGFVQEHV